MLDPAIGIITMFASTFAPQGWAVCEGQLLPIAQNTALFSILGTTYGGNGQTNFALPDLRGRSPIGVGQGPGLTNRTLGSMLGTENTTLLSTNLPAHNHTGTVTVATTSNAGTIEEPGGQILATGGAPRFGTSAGTNGSLGGASATISPTGGNQGFPIRQPFLGITFIIALQGVFPSRN
jgi:microcystin-dependent protein